MKAFELCVNGKLVAVIGRDGADNFNVGVTYKPNGDRSEISATSYASNSLERWSESCSWGQQQLVIGDEVTITFIEAQSADKPLEITKRNNEKDFDEYMERIDEMVAKMKIRMELEGEEVVLGPKSSKDKLFCSFCGKSKDEVDRLIKGPGNVGICDECVSICQELVVDKADEKPPPVWPRGSD